MGPRESSAALTDRRSVDPMPIARNLLAIFALAFIFFVNTTPASAAPVFPLDLRHPPSNYAQDGNGDSQVDITNLGDSASSGPLVLRFALSPGLSFDSVRQTGTDWSCPLSVGEAALVCTTETSL